MYSEQRMWAHTISHHCQNKQGCYPGFFHHWQNLHSSSSFCSTCTSWEGPRPTTPSTLHSRCIIPISFSSQALMYFKNCMKEVWMLWGFTPAGKLPHRMWGSILARIPTQLSACYTISCNTKRWERKSSSCMLTTVLDRIRTALSYRLAQPLNLYALLALLSSLVSSMECSHGARLNNKTISQLCLLGGHTKFLPDWCFGS